MFLVSLYLSIKSGKLELPSFFRPDGYRHRHYNQVIAQPSPLVLLNVALVGAVLALLAYFVVTTNAVTAREYSLRSLNDRLTSMQEKHSELAAEQNLLGDHATVLQFAQTHQMVEAHEVVRVIAPSAVALSH